MRVSDALFCGVHADASRLATLSRSSERSRAQLQPREKVMAIHFVALLRCFQLLFAAKSESQSVALERLSLGLSKMDGAPPEVEAMDSRLAALKLVVQQKQVECEKLLVQIIQQKREADTKRVKNETEGTRIAAEQQECRLKSQRGGSGTGGDAARPGGGSKPTEGGAVQGGADEAQKQREESRRLPSWSL